MDTVILLLVIGVSILLIKCVTLQIENKKILKAKTAAENKSASQNKEIEKLKKNLVETKRAVDFYSNITEDSGGLNGGDFENAKANLGSPDKEQAFLLDKMENESGNLFITGKAGTGKSYLLNEFKKRTKKSYLVLAPTGIAALNVGGSTLHSAFGYYNLTSLDSDDISYGTIRLKSEKIIVLKKVSTIIIDEISMVRADTFDRIDKILKIVNGSDSPFGGKQVFLFGDLFQLPPIVKRNEYKYLYDKYGGIYFFCSNAYHEGDFGYAELSINHRQKDDAKYFEILNRIRDGRTTHEDIDILNSRIEKDESVYDRFTVLLPRKADAEKVNEYRINQLRTPLFTYPATVVMNKYPDSNHSLESLFPIISTLKLKKGTLVMMTSNDENHRWVNGTIGIIKSLSNSRICVSIEKRDYEVVPEKFTEQEAYYQNGKIEYEDIFAVMQYPIIPAYAITIHKSQGQTYRDIICDIDNCFANGQAYVALSRCTGLSGLHLKMAVNESSIRVDKTVLDFCESQTDLISH